MLWQQKEGWRKCGPSAKGAEDLVTKDMKEASVLSAAFASGFTAKTSLQECQALKTSGKVWSREGLPSVEEDHVREDLN